MAGFSVSRVFGGVPYHVSDLLQLFQVALLLVLQLLLHLLFGRLQSGLQPAVAVLQGPQALLVLLLLLRQRLHLHSHVMVVSVVVVEVGGCGVGVGLVGVVFDDATY